MLVISLVFAAILLTAVNVAATRSKRPGETIGCLCLVFLIGPVFLTLYLPVVALLSVLLLAAMGIWKVSRRDTSSFRWFSLAAALIAVGFSGVLVYQMERGYDRLRARYPYESMEGRLPLPKPASPGGSPASVVLLRLDRMEEEMPGDVIRSWRLKMLHEKSVDLFINSAGFGFARMVPGPSESNLARGLRQGPTPLQPGPRVALARSPGEWLPLPVADKEPLDVLHDKSVIDFAYPFGFGYLKDRRHVAGFEAHRFGEVPGRSGRWEVQTVDLVGLLVHDEPVVYVSSRLPNMDELRGVPTRPLDKFESMGLTAIRGGDDLLIARDGDTPRMLGAIRSTRQCVACHGGDRGDLLGAFTYTLRRDEKAAADGMAVPR